MMRAEFLLNIVVEIANLGIGTYVLMKRPRSAANRSFFIFVTGIVNWSIWVLLTAWTQWKLFITFTLWSGELIVLGFVLLAIFFPDGTVSRRRVWLFAAPWFLIFFLTPTKMFIISARFNPAGYLEPQNGPFFSLWAVVMIAYLGWGFFTLLTRYRMSSGLERMRMRYLTLGAGIFLVAGLAFDIALPLFHVFRFNLLGPIFSLAFVACIAYAIVRYRLMDIRVVIQRGALYLLALLVIVIIFFAADLFLQLFIHNDKVDELSDIIAAIVGAFGFPYLRRFFEKMTEGFFFRKEYDASEALRRIGPLLGTTIEMSALIRAVRKMLIDTVRPERAFILIVREGEISVKNVLSRSHSLRVESATAMVEFFKEVPCAPIFFQEAKPLLTGEDGLLASQRIAYANFAMLGKQSGIAAVLPVAVRGSVRFALLLGKKMSGEIFFPRDMSFLDVLAHQADLAFENARLYGDIRRYSEELEARVAEKTEKIKGIYEAQSKFLTNISHELQTPIAILQGNVGILEGNGTTRAPLKVIRATLSDMAHLVGDLLEISKVNFFKDKLRKDRIEVGRFLIEVREDCLVLAEHKGITLKVHAKQCVVIGERKKLKEVLFNLINNALEHTEAGGTISLRCVLEGSYVKISVIDTGSGIPPDEASRIFERFYRMRGDETRGTGLGLNICREIIEAHGGSITLESRLGQGSTFTISLPVGVRRKV